MSYVNENDMDQLMRRASEQYPLRTDTADWEKIATELDRDPSSILPPVDADEKKKRRRRFVIFFLFVGILLGSYFAWNGNGKSRDGARNLVLTVDKKVASVQAKEEKVTAPEEKAAAHEIVKPENNRNAADPDKRNKRLASPQTSSVNEETVEQKLAERKISGKRQTAIPAPRNDISAATGENVAQNSGTQPGLKNGKNKFRQRGIKQNGLPLNSFDAALVENEPVHIGTDEKMIGKRDLPGTVAIDRSFNLTIDVLQKQEAQQAEKKMPLTKLKSEKSIYAGILFAPDLSMIRGQKITGSGYTAGILLGYGFNRHLAIETGISLDHKKYYTAGEYFSKDKVPQLQWINLLSVDGVCKMFEVPVNLRYNFGNDQKVQWFTTAGLSSYFMTNETYGYAYKVNNYTGYKSYTYTKPSQVWFSVVNLSVGFDRKIGRVGNMRLEPYVKIPLTGMGTGSLPILSTGLNIVLTRKTRL